MPAKMFGLDRKGRQAPGYDADLVVFDPSSTLEISGESPYGRGLYAVRELDLSRRAGDGIQPRDLVYRGGEVRSTLGRGRFVRRSTGPFPRRGITRL